MTAEILETEKQCQQSFVNTICESNRVTILIILTKHCVSKESTAENFTSRYQTHVTEVIKGTCMTTEWYPFVKFLARGG
jgi:hypothetical protein